MRLNQKPWDFRQNDSMVDDSIKLLNKDNDEIDDKLKSQIIIASNGDINWQFFAEWLTENEQTLSENYIEINSSTGEIYLNGENLNAENLYDFASAMTDENREEIQHIWEYEGNLKGFIKYRNTKVTVTNEHDTDYMPHLKFLVSRYNVENPNTSILFRHTQVANIDNSIRSNSKKYPDTFIAKMCDYYLDSSEENIVDVNLQKIMKNLHILNKTYTNVLTNFINIISRLLLVQPKIVEDVFFKPLKQMLCAKYSNALMTNKNAEQLIQYFNENKAELAYSFISSWYSAGKVPPHRENIVSLIPEIEDDQRAIEPSKFFENYYMTKIGGITMIPAILNTIMSFLIEENLNSGWSGQLTVAINSWFRNLTYDSLNGNRELEIISINQIMDQFSIFIDNYVSSFVNPDLLSDTESLINDNDWIIDEDDSKNSIIANVNSDSDSDIDDVDDIYDVEYKDDAIQFKTDQNVSINPTHGPIMSTDNAAQNYLLENILNLKQEEKILSDTTNMEIVKVKDKKETPSNRYNVKEISTSFFKNRLEDNIKRAKEARQKVRDSRRRYNIPIPIIKKEENEYYEPDVESKVKDYDSRKIANISAKKFDDNIDIMLIDSEEENKNILNIESPIELDDAEISDLDEDNENVEDLERRRDELSRRLFDSISQLPPDQQNMFPLVSVDTGHNTELNISTDKGQPQDITDDTRLQLLLFQDQTLSNDDYKLIRELHKDNIADQRNLDISKIISDNQFVDHQKQIEVDRFIIKTGTGHHLYKDAMIRENNRLANAIIKKNTGELSYDDYLPVYKNEDSENQERNTEIDEMLEDNPFELMRMQAHLKGIRLRDHPSFIKESLDVLEEADEMERLNENITDGRRVTSQEEIIRQLYNARNDRLESTYDTEHSLYNRPLNDLNALFLNGELSDEEEIEYLNLRQEAFDLQLRESSGWE